MSSETDAADQRSAGEEAAGSSSDGYVHDPSAFDESGERIDDAVDAPHPDAVDREFDWRGWVLVGVLVFAFVVSPLVVYLRPPPLPWWVALVVFPLLPAILLGVTAVWATTRP